QYNNGGSSFGGASNLVYDDTNNRVGIGTTSPGLLFSVQGDALFTKDLILDTSNIYIGSSTAASTTLIFRGSATSTITNNAFNAWSIGTSTVVGANAPPPILSVGSSGGLPRIGVATATPYAMFSINSLGGIPSFTIGSSTGQQFIVDSVGNVGIGTAGPSGKLHVKGAASTHELILEEAASNEDLSISLHNELQDERGRIQFTGSTESLIFWTRPSAGTITERVTITKDGNVGIGTTTPGGTLAMRGPASASPSLLVYAGATDAGADFLLRIADTFSTDPNTGGPVTIGLTNDISSIGLCYAGTDPAANMTRPIGDCTGTPSDYAEVYPVEQGTEYGEIVVLGDNSKMVESYGADISGTVSSTTIEGYIPELKRSAKAYDQRIIGITSNNWHDFTSAGKESLPENANKLPVALNGRVPVKVSTESGPISIGDRITSSSLPGVGMKATKDGVTVGIALEPFDGSEGVEVEPPPQAPPEVRPLKTGKILIFVNLGYSKLDDSVPSLASNTNEAKLGTPTNAFSVDQQSGKVNVSFYGSINLNGNYILDVGKITGYLGKWSVDEGGNITAETVTTKKLCLEEVCIEKSQLKTLLQNAGLFPGEQTSASSPESQPAIETSETSTTTATSTTP
ncbi:MAG: hypothetical protein AAB737_01960, partial [Patescibacteria group bacterium]